MARIKCTVRSCMFWDKDNICTMDEVSMKNASEKHEVKNEEDGIQREKEIATSGDTHR